VHDHTIVLPQAAKQRIDMVLAAVAGALLVLVLVTARGVIAGPAHGPSAPGLTAMTTELPAAQPANAPAPVPQVKDKKGGKGRD